MKRLSFLFCFWCYFVVFFLPVHALTTKEFTFSSDAIDVVIPCAGKDKDTLDLCIAGLRDNVKNIRRIIVISANKLTNKAEWFNENSFPITKDMVAFELFRNTTKADAFKRQTPGWLGWIYQQILKLYASYVIPNISSNVLVVDSDTIFLNSVTFIEKNGAGCFAPGIQHHMPYFQHMQRLLPGLKRVYPEFSGIANHMLFQKCVLDELKSNIEILHKKPMWKALLHSIDPAQILIPCLSEFEIYFNYALSKSSQFHIRKLLWADVDSIQNLQHYKKEGYHFVSAHRWLRKS